MNMKPIPVPAAGTALHWQLDAPYTARHVLIVMALLVVILFTGHRTEMDRMVVMSAQAVGNLVGVVDDSQVVRGLSRVGQSMWPRLRVKRKKWPACPIWTRIICPGFPTLKRRSAPNSDSTRKRFKWK